MTFQSTRGKHAIYHPIRSERSGISGVVFSNAKRRHIRDRAFNTSSSGASPANARERDYRNLRKARPYLATERQRCVCEAVTVESHARKIRPSNLSSNGCSCPELLPLPGGGWLRG